MKFPAGKPSFDSLRDFTTIDALDELINTFYPLNELYSHESMSGVDLGDSGIFFQALMQVVKQVGPDVDDQLLIDLFKKTTSVIQAKAAQVPALLSLLALFIKTCKNSSKDELVRYHTLIKVLATQDETTLNYWAKILITLGERVTDKNIHLLLEVQEGLQLNKLFLPELVLLFEYPPYPEIKSFIEKLYSYAKDLRCYADAFDKDPKSARALQKNEFGFTQKTTEQILNEQFDTSQVATVIAQLGTNANGIPLSRQEQYDLAQQVTYVNAIGKDKPLTAILGDDPLNKQIKTYHDLTKARRSVLRELSDDLIKSLRKPGLNAEGKLKIQLNLLAVLREQYFRVTGKLVNAKELIILVMSLKNQQNFALELIDSIKDKSAFNTILAVMQWVDANEKTVDEGYENQRVFAPDYYDDEAADFFFALGIPLSTVSRLVQHRDQLNTDTVQHTVTRQEKTEKDLVVSRAALANLKKQHDDGAEVSYYYQQRVSEIQQIVLEQFNEWNEFLHYVYPQTEWRKIDAALIRQKEELIHSLQVKWDECHAQSDPFKKFDELLNAYEVSVSTLWNEYRGVLKKKADEVIEEGSVNALRCHYLDGVSLSEHIQYHKLQSRENKKEALIEKKKMLRYLKSGMDVNGAMLHYADGDVTSYRNAFEKSLLQFFAEEIAKTLAYNTAFSKTVKSILVQHIESVRSLNGLIGFLVDYGSRYLPEDRFAEKYALQPIIQELLWVYQQAGLEKTEELQQLKALYFDDVAAEIIVDLENALSWAIEENRGLGYLIERSAVKTAANAVLLAVNQLKRATDKSSNQAAVRNLYKVLTQHEVLLEDVWIFSFGHKNTRTVIQQTLTTLNGLTVIGSDKNELDAAFIHECKEEALYDLMKEKLACVVKVIETEKYQGVQRNMEWQEIINSLAILQSKNNSVYAFSEMYYFLLQKVDELAKKHSRLQEPVIQLRGVVRNIFEKFSQEHQDLFNQSKYFAYKAENLKEKLTLLNGCNVQHVQLTPGTNSFSDFDLIIEGTDSAHPLFDDFIQYHSRSRELTEERIVLEKQQAPAHKQLMALDRLINEQLPLLKPDRSMQVNVSVFPEEFHAQVNELLTLKGWLGDQMPEDLSAFSYEMQESFHDRQLVKTLVVTDLHSEDIAKLHNINLRKGFQDLHEKIVESSKAKNSLSTRISSYISSFIYTPETMSDWCLEFNKLVAMPAQRVRDALQPEIDKKHTALATQLSMLRQQAFDNVESIKEKIVFLQDKINEEHAKSGVYMKRFTSPNEFLLFEAKVVDVIKKQQVSPLISTQKTAEDNLLHLLLAEDTEGVQEELFASSSRTCAV